MSTERIRGSMVGRLTKSTSAGDPRTTGHGSSHDVIGRGVHRVPRRERLSQVSPVTGLTCTPTSTVAGRIYRSSRSSALRSVASCWKRDCASGARSRRADGEFAHSAIKDRVLSPTLGRESTAHSLSNWLESSLRAPRKSRRTTSPSAYKIFRVYSDGDDVRLEWEVRLMDTKRSQKPTDSR